MRSEDKEFIEKQRGQWNEAAPAWERWDAFLDVNMAFVSYRLVGDARLRKGQRVLDLGSGTGYPAILAAQAVGETGEVLGLDLSEEMLSAARRKARKLGLSNVTFRTCDVSSLDLEGESFDAVLSRFCLMFLPDVQGTLSEIARVLRPGGYLAASVWSDPAKNPFVMIPVDILKNYTEVPAPLPGTPGIFRLAFPGDLLSMAEKAGLTGLADDEIISASRFASADEYLANLKEMAAPLKPLFEGLAEDMRAEAEAGIREAAGRYAASGGIELPMAFRVVSAQKPPAAG